jgi:N-acyl-D-aspartate/D-glutamate deacylase
VGEIARERGQDAFDTLLDVVIADGLRTGLMPHIATDTDADWELRTQVWRDPRAVRGGRDAGAHLDMMCGATYPTTLLAEAVVQRDLLSWEEAVALLSAAPARLYGLRDRGRLVLGAHADVLLLDPATICSGPVVTREDLPGGASRLVADATGVEAVYVAGTAVARAGQVTGNTPGTLLRSGRDTDTVSSARPAP